jgi:membrane protein YdbS with pleckstrin-like domain
VYDRAEMRSPRAQRILAVLSETFWLLIIGVIAMFLFFVALGAFNPTQVLGLTIVVVVLAVLWIAHAAWVSRHHAGRDPASVRARERRGF